MDELETHVGDAKTQALQLLASEVSPGTASATASVQPACRAKRRR